MKTFAAPALLLGAILFNAPASADARNQQQCAIEFDACVNDCKTTYRDDPSGRAACMPQCSGKYAACDAGVAYDKAKPWIEEQARKTKKFFDDMIKNIEKDEPAPPQKDKSI